MPKLIIDTKPIEVADGTTILEAARLVGADIPTLCHLEGRKGWNHAGCMICTVSDRGRMVPSCVRPVEDGMVIETDTPALQTLRKGILEVMLSDHIGDCEGPCSNTCPAGMEIPQMMRQVHVGGIGAALATVKRDIALPAVLGRICPEVCENACRRRLIDSPLSICLVKRYCGDHGTKGQEPVPAAPTGHRIAVVGAGPAGLSAAFYLRLDGHEVEVFDAGKIPGGTLAQIPDGKLPPDVLEREIAVIRHLGVVFHQETHIDAEGLKNLRQSFAAVFVAVGNVGEEALKKLGIANVKGKATADVATLATKETGLFVGGDALRQRKLGIRSVADGKIAARSIGRFLAKQPLVQSDGFASKLGKVSKEEVTVLMEPTMSRLDRTQASGGHPIGLSAVEVKAETARCLHCDCRAKDDCDLRRLATRYGAKQNRFTGRRRTIQAVQVGKHLIYDPGKCIACGKCVYLTTQAKETFGLTYFGRGFPMKIDVPFGKTIDEALSSATAKKVIHECPTGALCTG